MTVPRVNLSITRPFARTLVTPQISRLNLQVAAKPRKIGSSWHIGKIRMHAKKKEKIPLSLSLSLSSLQSRSGTEVAIHGEAN